MVPEILTGVEPVFQPSPGINPGGDCFACAMLAITKHYDRETMLEVSDCVAFWKNSKYDQLDNYWGGIKQSFHNMPQRWDIIYDPCIPRDLGSEDFHPNWGHWGLANWEERLHAYLKAGWTAFAPISYTGIFEGYYIDGERSPGNRPYRGSTDHFVIIDGIRSFWQDEYEGEKWLHGTGKTEIHIVCSVKGKYWMDLSDFQTWHGGMSYMLIKPRPDWPRRR